MPSQLLFKPDGTSGSYTGSLFGSASYALTASFVSGAYTANWTLSGSYANTASYVEAASSVIVLYQNPLQKTSQIPAGYDFNTFGPYQLNDGVILIIYGRQYVA